MDDLFDDTKKVDVKPEGVNMDDDQNTNGDEDFKKYLQDMANSNTAAELLLKVNCRKVQTCLQLMKVLQNGYVKFSQDDCLKKTYLSWLEEVYKTMMSGIRFFDYMIFTESEPPSDGKGEEKDDDRD